MGKKRLRLRGNTAATPASASSEVHDIACKKNKATPSDSHNEEYEDKELQKWLEIEKKQGNSHHRRGKASLRHGTQAASSQYDSDDDDDNEDGDSDAEIPLEGHVGQETEDFTFEFHDMRKSFDEGITVLLRSLIPNPTAAYSVASAIVAQEIVGTAVVCEGGEDVFAFSSVISPTKYIDSPLHNLLRELAKAIDDTQLTSVTARQLHSQATSLKAGLMIHKRFANLPLELLAPLHENLLDDVLWAKDVITKGQPVEDPTDEPLFREFGAMTHVLLLDTCTLDISQQKQSTSASLDSTAISPAAVEVTGSGVTSSILFDAFENEIYAQHAITVIVFQPKGFHGSKQQQPEPPSKAQAQRGSHLAVMLLEVKALRKCCQEIAKLCNTKP